MGVLLLSATRRPGRTRPEGTVDFVDPAQLLLEGQLKKHEGRVVKSEGESTLSWFSSAPKALACALALQARAAKDNRSRPDGQRFYLRFSLHLSGAQGAETPVSESEAKAVSLLLDMTPYGRVFLTRQVYELSRTQGCGFVPLSLDYFPGLKEPLEVYEAIQPSWKAASL